MPSRPYARLLLSSALADLAFNAPLALVPLWLIARREDPAHIALAMFVAMLVNLAFTLPSGWMADRIDNARALHIGISGAFVLTAAMVVANGWQAFAIVMAVRSCFIALFGTAAFSLAIKVSRADRAVYALTWLAMAITASYAVGPAVVTFAWKHGYEHVQFLWCAAAALAAALLAFTLRESNCASAERAAAPTLRRAHVTEWLAPLFFAMSVSTVGGVNNTLAVVALHLRGLDGGLLFTGAALGMLAARIPAAAAVNRYGSIAPSIALAVLMCAGTLCVAGAGSNAAILTGGFLIGVAWSAMLPACTQTLIQLAGPQARGRAMASYGFALSLGSVLGSAAATRLADCSGGYATALVGAGLLPVLGIGAMMFAARRQAEGQPAI